MSLPTLPIYVYFLDGVYHSTIRIMVLQLLQSPAAWQLHFFAGAIWQNKSVKISTSDQVFRSNRLDTRGAWTVIPHTDVSQVYCYQRGIASPDHDISLFDGSEVDTIKNRVRHIKDNLSSIGDGRISVSPYDTAWVALIKNNIEEGPQFPSSLEWIAKHQLHDGSWGEELVTSACDRLLNTLACVVALRSWNVHSDKARRGISFIKENLQRLANVDVEHVTSGFEFVFPALLTRAKNLGIDDIPYDSPVIRDIYAAKALKLERIPKELMHNVPTTALYSLEGYEDLDWPKLLKLQDKSGSFHLSPSSTAFAYMQTRDQKCFQFLQSIVNKFNGGAQHAYPVEIFARLWAVDRLQRLGISYQFESEIDEFLQYVHRFWTDMGVYVTRDSAICDVDDTSMAFRLLRMQGYDINPNVFEKFKMGSKFYCFAGAYIEGISPMYNLYRASQLLFPGEEILEEAKDYSYNFLDEKITSNQLLDKWVISKNFPDEIRTGLEIPFYSGLPRIETMYYLEHYSGANDVWIAKTLHRMPDISNNDYLELAKLDFKRCQAQHQIEWTDMQIWYDINKDMEFGVEQNDVTRAYFLASASIFQPKRSRERIAWAKSQIISDMIASFLEEETTTAAQKIDFLAKFNNVNGISTYSGRREERLIECFQQYLEEYGENTSHQLKAAWCAWLKKLHEKGIRDDGELLASILNIITCNGNASKLEILLSHHEYKSLSKLTNRICRRLKECQHRNVSISKLYRDVQVKLEEPKFIRMKHEIEYDMKALVQMVLEEQGSFINRNVKQTFLQIAKTFYYTAYTAPEKIEMHISRVLFQPLV